MMMKVNGHLKEFDGGVYGRNFVLFFTVSICRRLSINEWPGEQQNNVLVCIVFMLCTLAQNCQVLEYGQFWITQMTIVTSILHYGFSDISQFLFTHDLITEWWVLWFFQIECDHFHIHHNSRPEYVCDDSGEVKCGSFHIENGCYKLWMYAVVSKLDLMYGVEFFLIWDSKQNAEETIKSSNNSCQLRVA